MKGLKFGSAGMELVNGDLAMVSDQEETGQCARIALSINKGEWFLNPELGIDQSIFTGKNLDEEAIRDEIRSCLLTHVGEIDSVDEVTFVQDTMNRKMGVSFKATSSAGESISNDEAVSIDAG